jgi:glycosyltransferase involved in cell wall biosynthesis
MGIPNRGWLDAARGRREILRRAIDGCDAIVVLSRNAAEALEDSLGQEPRIIPPGVDLTAFKPAAVRSHRPTLLCSAAPEVERKNVRLLIEAFALLRRERPDARLILSRPTDRRAAQRAGLDIDIDGVEWADLDDRRLLAQACAEAWVAVLPSVGEAFGLVLVEALACGTPVVGYAHGAIPEIIDRPEIGRLFAPLTAEALLRALLEALELAADPATAARCRARAEDFSTERCVDRYLSLYRELLGSGVKGTPTDNEVAPTFSKAAR